MVVDTDHILKLIEEGFDSAADAEDNRTVEVLIAGRTGAGKSTLVNAVFHSELAETGMGEPVTRQTRRFTKEGSPLAITDTRGLELEHHQEIIDDLMAHVRRQADQPHPDGHIHIAWMCIPEDGRRLEEGETKLVEQLAEYMPVLGIITKARADKDVGGASFCAVVRERLRGAKDVLRVRAIPERLDDDHVLPPFGLAELAKATAELITPAMRSAFARAQKVDVDQKIAAAKKVVRVATVSAGTLGATPIPLVDAGLVPIQVVMLVSISRIFFGTAPSRTFFRSLIASLGATAGARMIVATLLKFIPGAGSVAGAIIGGSTAAGFTLGLGKVYTGTLARRYEKSGDRAPSEEDLEDLAREVKSGMGGLDLKLLVREAKHDQKET